MQFSSALIAAVAFGFAYAKPAFTNAAFNGITAGQPIELTWSDASGPVTITLKNGPSGNLQTVSTVASGVSGSSFTWNVPATLAKDTYALEISDSTGPNYSPQFELVGGTAATSSAASSSASSSASASSSLSSVSSSVSSASSSLSSATSSTSSSLSTASTTANSSSTTAAPSTTGATNGTTTARSTSAGRTSSAPASSTTASVPNSNSAADIASPLALVFLTFAAIFSLN